MPRRGETAPASIYWLIASNLERIRKSVGASQEDVAETARLSGLDWTRATVADLETGRRDVKVHELISLPAALSGLSDHDVELEDLIAGVEWVGVGHASYRPSGVAKILAGHQKDVKGREFRSAEWDELDRATRGEAERHVAASLSVDPLTVAASAQRLWGKSLTERRDELLVANPGTGQRTGRRGWVTRALAAEIAEDLKSRKTPRPKSRPRRKNR